LPLFTHSLRRFFCAQTAAIAANYNAHQKRNFFEYVFYLHKREFQIL